jgi:hypothetical protein
MMKKIILMSVVLLNCSVSIAGLTSGIPSTYKEIDIPNSHLLSENIIRGMAPRNQRDLEDLVNHGIENFLMFKIDTNGAIAKEIEALLSLGIEKKNILHLPFPWKDVSDYTPICEMTIEALNMMRAADFAGKKLFLHCTVGEDRTGYLSGLYKIYSGSQESLETIFQSELCDKGYEAGNPKKIYSVVQKVRESLTPAFLGMSSLVSKNKAKKLTKSLCRNLKIPVVDFNKYSCKKSRLL